MVILRDQSGTQFLLLGFVEFNLLTHMYYPVPVQLNMLKMMRPNSEFDEIHLPYLFKEN